MRLLVRVRPLREGITLSFGYQYWLSSVIYKWIEQSSPSYSEFLHTHGFSPDGLVRRFKHFCFSQLLVENREVDKNRQKLKILSPVVSWYISMPVDETLKHIVVGIFEKQEFYIDRAYNRFAVERVEILPEPLWERKMKFTMLSPVTVSVPKERNGKLIPEYLRANDARLSDALRSNIINKYLSLYKKELQDDEFKCLLDDVYIEKRGGYEKVSKLVVIKEGAPDETKVKGIMCPLTIEGNPELIKLAYESGLGEKNSLGFGMIEVADKKINR